MSENKSVFNWTFLSVTHGKTELHENRLLNLLNYYKVGAVSSPIFLAKRKDCQCSNVGGKRFLSPRSSKCYTCELEILEKQKESWKYFECRKLLT